MEPSLEPLRAHQWSTGRSMSPAIRRIPFRSASGACYGPPHRFCATRELDSARNTNRSRADRLASPEMNVAAPMSEYAIGIEDHYAWANLVSLTRSGLDDILLDKRRVELLDQQLPASPYHHDALHMTLPEADTVVRGVTASANARAASALSSLIRELAPARCRGIAIRVPPLPNLPTVAEAHASAWVRNRADGMIYHRALTQAAAELDLGVLHFDRDTVLDLAAQARGQTGRDLERQLKAFGTTFGPPWRKGQILACAGAILALLSTAPSRPTTSHPRVRS